MFNDLSKYLKKFTVLTPPDKVLKEEFKKAVENLLGVSLKDHEISIRGGTIFVTTTPVIKTEIVMQKGTLLRKMKEGSLSTFSIKEIR